MELADGKLGPVFTFISIFTTFFFHHCSYTFAILSLNVALWAGTWLHDLCW